MTAKTKTALGAEIAADAPDNTVGTITPALLRTMLQDMVDSLVAAPAVAKYTKNTTAGAPTAAAGDLTGAIFVSAEYSAVGAASLTTRTAALMLADAGGSVAAGDSYVLKITNTSGGTTTLVAGTGVTLTGTMTIASNTTRQFVVTFTDATHLVIQSIGVGTIS
jgi:hypothetical protein